MSGWVSSFAALPDQLRHHGDGLAGLIGQLLIAGWTGWRPDTGRWFPIIPLVLVFEGGAQLELSWNHRDELSVTWNTIDLAVPPHVFGKPCEWRSSQPDPLIGVAGRTLTGFATVETPYFQGDDLDFSKGLPMHAVAGWTATGLWIGFGDCGLLVYSAAEDNGLSAEQIPPGHENATRLTPWPSS
jgi:hypothetical protein